DISMPGMTGVEILKECRLLGLPSKVILISGFQDFEYAKAGIQYGAVDYLLKPVIRDELLRAIDKSISQREQELQREPERIRDGFSEDYRGLLPLEEGPYLPVYVEIFLEEDNRQMERLTRFSVLSFMENYLEEQDLGIAFAKKENLVVVFKGLSQKEGEQAAILLMKEIEGRFACPAGAVVGRPVEQMSEIPGEFQECLYMREYFFFRNQMALPVLLVGETVFSTLGGNSHLLALRGQMIDMVVAQEKEKLQKCFDQFAKTVCRMADGKKEDALFYLCSAIRVLDEKFRGLALPHPDYDEKQLLQKGRECRDYGGLQNVFYGIVLEYLEKLKTSVVNSSSREFLKAKVYIDEHYDENLTLEVLAGEVHMNPYYFS
ncbi:MAG TPA: DNA-binding response regulator, partial [Lachnospiraceae bacterium]|nr:DNA-binding response regulator [Lachnospiraceae bacterium]